MSLIASYNLLGNSNPTVGTITGTENNITYGPAATFNGVDSSINFGNNFNLGNRGFTIKCRVKVQPGSMRSTIFSKYLFTATCAESGFNVDVLDTGQIRFVVEGNCNNYIFSDSTISIADGQFHELIVYRTFGNNIFILIDGIDRTGSYAGPGGVTNINNSVDFVIGHPSSSAYLAYASSLNGEIQDVEIYDSAYGSDIRSDLISWYNFDTNFNDSYGTNHATGTNTGLVYGKKGNSAYFNGANSMVTIPGSASINEAYLNVSISYWVKFRSTANCWIFMKSFGGGAGGDYFMSVSGQKIRAATLGGTGAVLALNTFVLDQWYHVALVFRSGISLELYIDNQLQGIDTSPGDISANSDPLTIGDNPYFTNYRLEGFIDMFGIFNRALSPDEVSLLYNNGLGYDPFSTLSLKTGLLNYYNLNGNSIDVVSGNNGVDSNVIYTTGKISQGVSFNGSSSKIVINNQLSQTEGSISIWVYHNSAGAVTRFYSDNGGYAYFEQNTFGGSNNIHWLMYTGSGGINLQTTFSTGVWTHYVATWKSSGISYLYKNGVQVSAVNTPVIVMASAVAQLGAVANILNFDGLIDEAAFYNRQLSSSEAIALYNSGNGYDPFSTFVGNPVNSDKLAHWKLNGNSLDEVGVHNGSDVSISYVTGRDNYAAKFTTANSSVINVPIITLSRFVSYSFALWIYIDPSISNYAGVFTNNNTGYGVFYNPFNKTIYWNGSTGCAPNGVPFGKWVHVAFNNNAGTGQFYINGQPSGSPVNVLGDIYMMTLGFSDATYPFKGSMDDVRIYNRVLTTTEIKSLSQLKSFNFLLYT